MTFTAPARAHPRALERNEKGGSYFDDLQRRLRTDGLPATKVLSGD